MLRIVLLTMTLALVACTTGQLRENLPSEKLQAANTGVVIVHTSLHDQDCRAITAVLAQPDASGRLVRGERVTLKGQLDFEKVPSQVVLPAGDYGIVQFECVFPYRNTYFNAPVAERGSVIDGSGTIHERAIVTFSVQAGEIVDIGSVRLTRGRALASAAGRRRLGFVPVVAPMPEPWLQRLAEKKPELFKARITRLMSVPSSG